MNEPFPADSMSWGTAATQDSTSWFHIDDHGLATAVTVVTGAKYWVLAGPKEGEKPAHLSDGNGDISSLFAFAQHPANSPFHEAWDHEGVLLGPGDVL